MCELSKLSISDVSRSCQIPPITREAISSPQVFLPTSPRLDERCGHTLDEKDPTSISMGSRRIIAPLDSNTNILERSSPSLPFVNRCCQKMESEDM